MGFMPGLSADKSKMSTPSSCKKGFIDFAVWHRAVILHKDGILALKTYMNSYDMTVSVPYAFQRLSLIAIGQEDLHRLPRTN